MIIKILTTILISLMSNYYFSQVTDLCGVWIADKYSCYTISPNGTMESYTKVEVVYIDHDGDYTTATKIIGDGCVTDGQITWQGNYSQNPFYVSVTLGNPLNPSSSSMGASITVIDSEHLLGFNVSFVKATCKQIDSLNIDLDKWNTGCVTCSFSSEIEIPNIFTPNNDGINDLFIPKKYKHINKSSIQIFNRWGNLVYDSNDVLYGWNGESKNIKCSNGIYFWIVNYTDEENINKIIKGSVNLVR